MGKEANKPETHTFSPLTADTWPIIDRIAGIVLVVANESERQSGLAVAMNEEIIKLKVYQSAWSVGR